MNLTEHGPYQLKNFGRDAEFTPIGGQPRWIRVKVDRVDGKIFIMAAEDRYWPISAGDSIYVNGRNMSQGELFHVKRRVAHNSSCSIFECVQKERK